MLCGSGRLSIGVKDVECVCLFFLGCPFVEPFVEIVCSVSGRVGVVGVVVVVVLFRLELL